MSALREINLNSLEEMLIKEWLWLLHGEYSKIYIFNSQDYVMECMDILLFKKL